MKTLLTAFLCAFVTFASLAQPNQREIGAWYMYFWNTKFKESKFGLQGDVQHRNWNVIGDLEQLLLRGGFTFSPNDDIKFTLGYGNVTTGAYGDDKSTTSESRIYQEALFSNVIGTRVKLTHRFRYEQRFVENQDFRSRYRYNLFMNVPLNKPVFEEKTVYLALYNELFINGERKIGVGRSTQIFDRNRSYAAIGYMFKKNLKVQLGMMHQITNNWEKTQLQVSLHHKF